MLLSLILMSLTLVMSEGVVTDIVQGKIRGVRGDGYVSYYGIPYANITDMRAKFKRAGLAPRWNNIREPDTSSCPGSKIEDCLTLDVHVPDGKGYPIPVLAWIKTGDNYNPGKLVNRGIIVVIIKHRVGPLGFMCPGHEKIPGNAGAKDVVVALRWIGNNIIAFRGNQNRIILGGQNFGAAIVEALLTSQMAEGLFHGAIMQSGSVFTPWAFNYNAKERAMKLATSLSDSVDDDEIASVFMNTNVDKLNNIANELDVPYFPFGLCVEHPSKDEERLIFDKPIASKYRKTKVPVLIGFNSNEAYVFVSDIIYNNVLRKLKYDINFLLPEELKISSENAVKKIKDLYFSGNRTMAAVLTYYRDAYFMSHIYKSAISQSKSGVQVYLYQFSHTSSIGVEPEPGVKKTGAAHSDELAYLFVDKGRNYDGDNAVVQDKLVTLWTDFVKFLEPTPKNSILPKWEMLNQFNPRIYNIDTEPAMQEFPYKRHVAMWDELFQNYYNDKPKPQRGSRPQNRLWPQQTRNQPSANQSENFDRWY